MRVTYMLATAIIALGLVHVAHASPTVEIVMEQTTYSYCEKLFYTIKVSEIVEEHAIIHIIDEMGKKSSAVPIEITGHETPVSSQIAFSKEIFPLGVYLIDIKYAGEQTSTEFTLVDSGKKCIPGIIKTIIVNWIGGTLSDGLMIDAIDRYVDKEIVNIPFQITEQNIGEVNIPSWVKGIAYWWIQEEISDDMFAGALEYLMQEEIITVTSQNGSDT